MRRIIPALGIVALAGLALWGVSARSSTGEQVETTISTSPHHAQDLADHQGHPRSTEASSEGSGHGHDRCELHGGHASMTRAHHFETLFRPDGIAVHLYTDEQAPLMVAEAKGTVTLKWKDGTTKSVNMARVDPAKGFPTVYFCPMHEQVVEMEPGECKLCNGMKLYAQDLLFAPVDLSRTEPGSLKATVRVTNLKGDVTEATFTETFKGLAPAKASEKPEGHEHHHD